MKIFWMLTSVLFKLEWLLPLLKNFIYSLLCCFINIEERMLQSQIACHTFLCLSWLRSLLNWLTETRDMPKELRLFYVVFLTVKLYIQLNQFIIVPVTLPTLSHQVPSSFILVLKGFIWTSWTFWLWWTSRSLLEITIPDSKQYWLSSNINF